MTYTKTALSDADIEYGRKLWHDLGANSRFPVRCALWLLEGEWHLVIASEIVDRLGARDAYRKLAAAAELSPDQSAQLSRIDLIGLKHPLYQSLSSAFSKAASVEGVRLGGSQVGNVYIDDAYLYGVREP
ncbi:MAG TPA: hypothetical protein VI386_03610 [Candidatus Sulfotelmatobacter sp.]